jgi:hypothetical protein
MRLAELPLHETFAQRWADSGSDGERATVLADARTALRNARRTPAPEKALLEPGSLAWKREIANDRTTESGELCRLNSISRTTLKRYRDLYREDEVA